MKHILLILRVTLSFCLINAYQIHTTNQSFFDTIETIKKDLYKISATELAKLLPCATDTIPTISAKQLKNEIAHNNDLLVINVLPEHYYHDCHITGSINAPLTTLIKQAKQWDPCQKIVLYCALKECDAGQKGCILLKCMGFINVIDYKGGIKEWYQLGYPTQGPALSTYLHIRTIPLHSDEYQIYPHTLVCSNQARWIHRYGGE